MSAKSQGALKHSAQKSQSGEAPESLVMREREKERKRKRRERKKQLLQKAVLQWHFFAFISCTALQLLSSVDCRAS